MVSIFSRFRKKDEGIEAPTSGLYLDRANFSYPVGFGGFKSFFYDFDIVLPFKESEKVIAVKSGVERVSNLIEHIYSSDERFRKDVRAEMSSDKREIKMSYSGSGSNLFGSIANINFTATMDGEKIKRAYFFLHLYGINPDDLILTHDAVIGLPNIRFSDGAKSTLEQIAKIRNGNGPRIENLLLN